MSREGANNPNYKHGETKTRLHKIWTSMKQRCHNPTTQGFENYGGRGISVCDEWRNDYLEFKNWSLNNGYSDVLEIDRTDNDRGYAPDNCRWVTKSANCRNTRRNNLVEAFGEIKTISDWAEDKRCAVNHGTLRSRLVRGTNPEDAISSTRIIANQFVRIHK